MQFKYTHNSTINTNNAVTLEFNNRWLIHFNIKTNNTKFNVNLQLVKRRH